MKRIVCLGGGPAGPVLRDPLQEGAAARTRRGARAQPARTTRSAGAWCSPTRPWRASATSIASPTMPIVGGFYHWDDVDVHFKGQRVRSGGHGFCGIGRKHLLNVLQARAESLGVEQTFQHEIEDDAQYRRCGPGRRRRRREQPRAQAPRRRFQARYRRAHAAASSGSARISSFEAFTFAFERTEHGWFQIHAYQFSPEVSTVIVETREETWQAHGLDALRYRPVDRLLRAAVRQISRRPLAHEQRPPSARLGLAQFQSRALRALARRQPRPDRRCGAHGALQHRLRHQAGDGRCGFAGGQGGARRRCSGRRSPRTRPTAVSKRSSCRAPRAIAWNGSRTWIATRTSSRCSSRTRCSRAVSASGTPICGCAIRLSFRPSSVISAARSGAAQERPPMFLPFRLRDMELVNRVVVSPMAQYLAVDGMPVDWHLVHYGSRACGGAGLVVTEMTCVGADARITPGCTGLWNEEQAAAWKRIVDFVHASSPAKICLQLGHAGRKGSTQLGWEQIDHPLAKGNWPLISRLAAAVLRGHQPDAARDDSRRHGCRDAPLSCSGPDWVRMRASTWSSCTWRTAICSASFLSPLTNVRNDEYGGSLENRLRYPLEVLRAVRAAWPASKPVSVRISACDWVPEGISEGGSHRDRARDEGCRRGSDRRVHGPDRAVAETGLWPNVSNAFLRPDPQRRRHCDRCRRAISTNRTTSTPSLRPVARILCAVARPHLADPSWTLHAAAGQQYSVQWWPKPYENGKSQLERNLERAAQMVGAV